MLAARLHNRSLWEGFYLYRTVLVTLRMVELVVIIVRLFCFRGPLLIAWTRLPGLRGRKSPYGDLAKILGPVRDRPSLLVHEVNTMTPGDCKTKEDLRVLCDRLKLDATVPRPTRKTIFGGLLRAMFAEMGPCYIKLAQIISMRPEMPPFLREELQIIQDSLPPIKKKTVKNIIDREMRRLGKRTENVFEWIEEEPLASASLGQVNRAKLRTGEEVALKIQRPNLRGYVAVDSTIIVEILIVRLAPMIRLVRNIDLSVFHASFRSALKKEVDFYHEARTQDGFRQMLSGMPHYADTIMIANVYFEYTTDKLITMELAKNFHRADRLADLGVDRLWELMQIKVPGYPEHFDVHMFRMISALWGDMSLYWGWLHGDPHLGNFYFMEPQDGYNWRIFVCDFGMVEEFPPQVLRWIEDGVVLAWLWRNDIEQMFFCFKNIEPARVYYSGLCNQPTGMTYRTMRARTTLRSLDEFANAPPGKTHLVLEPVFFRIFRGRLAADNSVVGGDSRYYIQTRRPGGQTYSREVLESVMLTMSMLLSALIPPGTRLERIMQHHNFLWWKQKLYLEEVGSTLWSGSSWNDEWIHGVKERIKERVLCDLRWANVVDLREYMDDLGQLLQQPDMVSGLLSAGESDTPTVKAEQ